MNLNEIPAWSDIESQPWFAELTPEEKQQSLTKWQGDMMQFAKDPKEKFAVAATSKAKARSFFGEEMPDDPIADALQRRQKDLEDIGSRYDAFSKGELEEDDEEVLTLNDTLKGNTPYSVIKGRLFVSPQLVWDKAAYEKVVNEAPVDEDERVLAMSAYDGSKERAAEGVVNSLGYTDEEFRNFAAKGFKEGKSNAAILDEWKANNKLPEGILGSLRGVGRQAYFGLRSGLSGLERAMGGLGGFFGSESAQKYAEESGKEAQSYMQRTLGEGPEFIGELTSGAVSIIPTIAAGASASVISEGAALPAAASITAGAIQSAGATQAETYEFYRNQGLDHANALAESRADGLVSGLITGAITHYAGKLGDKIGLGKGIEGLFSGPASKIASKLTQREISESLKAGAKAVGGSFLQEGSEELLDQAAQDAYSMIKRDPTLTLAEAINNALQAGKVGAVLGGAAEAGKIGLKSLLNSAKFAVPTTEEEEALRAKFEVPAAVEEEVIASPEVQQEEQNIKTATDVVKEAAPVAPQTAAVLAGITEEKAGELAADVVGATEDALASVEEEAPLVVDETPLVLPASETITPTEAGPPVEELVTPAVTTAPLVPIPTEETQQPQPVETPTNAAPEIPLEESLRQEPQDRVEVGTPEETGVGDSIQRAAEGEKEVAVQKVFSALQRHLDSGGEFQIPGNPPVRVTKKNIGQFSVSEDGSLMFSRGKKGGKIPLPDVAVIGAQVGAPFDVLSLFSDENAAPAPVRSSALAIAESDNGSAFDRLVSLVGDRGKASEEIEILTSKDVFSAWPVLTDVVADSVAIQKGQEVDTQAKADALRQLYREAADLPPSKERADALEQIRLAASLNITNEETLKRRKKSPPTTGAVPTKTLPAGQEVTPRGVASPGVAAEAAPEPAPKAQPVSQPVQAFRDAVSQMSPTAQAKWTPELRATAEAYLDSGGTTGLQGLNPTQEKIIKRILDETTRTPEQEAAIRKADAEKLRQAKAKEKAERARESAYRESSLPPTPGKQIRKIGKGAMESVPVVLDEIAKAIPNIRELVEVRESVEGEPDAEGFYDPQADKAVVLVDNVYLKPQHGGSQEAALRETIIHELLHRGFAKLRQTNPQLFEQFEAYSLADTNDAQFDALVRRGYSMYSNWKDDPAQNQKAREEIFIRKAVVDLNFKGIEAIKSPTSLASQFFSWLRDLLNKLLGRKVDDETLLHWSRVFLNAAQADFIEKTPGERMHAFAGEKAIENLPEERRQFMRDSLETAKAMAAAGKDSEEIRAVTGWFPGKYDGKMRWEVPDEGSALHEEKVVEVPPPETQRGYFRGGVFYPDVNGDLYAVVTDGEADIINTGSSKQEAENRWYEAYAPNKKRKVGGTNNGKLFEVLDHPALFDAYPTLKEVDVEFRPLSDRLGDWTVEKNLIRINSGISKDRALSTLLHEAQHAIQSIEGFAKGSSVSQFSDYTGEAQKRFDRFRDILDSLGDAVILKYNLKNGAANLGEAKEQFRKEFGREPHPEAGQHAKFLSDEEIGREAELAQERLEQAARTLRRGDAFRQYQLTAGEIEARDVQARQKLTPEQRAATAPYSSENIAKEDAIVMFGSGGAQMSMSRGRDLLSPEKYARHAELEAKHNAGTITPEETAEAQALVEEAAKAAGFNVGPVPHGTTAGPFNEFRTPAYFGSGASMYAQADSEIVSWKGPRVRVRQISPSQIEDNLDSVTAPQGFTFDELYEGKANGRFVSFGNDGIYRFDGVDEEGDLLYSLVENLTPVRDDSFNIVGVEEAPPPSEFPRIIRAYLKMSNPAELGAKEGSRLAKGPNGAWDQALYDRLVAAGHDGVIADDDWGGPWNKHYVVFSPNQIKSADPFTGVPLEQRFQPTSPDIRYSLADKDAEYLDAVESGDMEKAQRMVDEAAKAAGFNVGPVYHETRGDFNEFLVSPRGAIFFAFSPERARAGAKAGAADGFGRGTGRTIRAFIKADAIEGVSLSAREKETFYKLPQKILTMDDLRGLKKQYPQDSDWIRGAYDSGGNKLPKPPVSDLAEVVKTGRGLIWGKSIPDFSGVEDEAARHRRLRDEGYDAGLLADEAGISLVVLNPSQIKSADPVTYDDAGNVIPLSQRLQTVSPDIRYSLGEPPDMQAEADALREVTPSSQALDKFRETFGTPRQDVGQVLGKKEGSVYTQAQVAPLSQHARNVIGFDVNEEGDPVVNPKATQKALDLVSKLLNTKGYASRFNTQAAKLFEGTPVDPEIASAVLVQELQAYANRLSASSPKAEDQILKAALTPFYNTVILGNYLTLRTAGRALQAAGRVSNMDDARKSREEAEKAVNKEITKQLGDEALPAAEGMDKAGVEGGVDAIKDDIPAPADPTLRLLDLAVESLDEVAKAKTERVFDILFEIGQLEELVAQDEKVGNKAMSILRNPNLAARNYPTDPAERKALLAQKKAELATALDEALASLQGAKPETRKKVKAKAAKTKSKTDSIQKLIDKLSKMPDESKEAKPKAETLRAAIADVIKEKEFDEQKVRDAATKFGATPEQTERLVEEAERIHEIRQSPKLSKAKLRQFLLSFPKNVLANPEQREALLRAFLTEREYTDAEINRIVPQVLRDFDTGYQKARKAYLDELEKKLKPKQGQKESKQDQQNRKMLNALRSGLADTTSEASVALAKSLGFEAFRPQDDHILSKLDEEMRKLREQGRLSDSNAKFDAIKSLLIRRRPPRGFGEVVAQSWITSALSSLSNLAVNVWAPMGEAGVRLMSDIVRATALGKFDEIPLYLEAAGKAMKGTLSRFNFAVKTDTFTNSVNTLIAGMASMKDEMQRSAAVLKDKNASPAAKANAGLRYAMSFGDYSRRILSSIDDTWYTALSSYVGSSNLIKLLGDAKMPKKAVEAIVFHANNDALNQARAEYETLQAVEQFIEAMRGKTNEEIDAGFEYLGLNDASVTKEQANYIQELVSAFQSLRLRSGATGDELIKRALKELRNFRASVSVRATELGQMRTKELVREALSDTQTPAQVEEAIKEFDENAKKAASFGMGLHRVEGVPPYDILGNMFGIVDAMGRQAVQKSPLLGRMIVGFFGIPLNLLNRAVWFTPYGLGRYFLAKWQMAKNPEEKFYEYSMASQRERTMRFTEAAVGTSMTMLLYALGVARDSDDKEDEGFYITLGGPSNKTEYDAWYARGFRKFSICYKTKSGSVVSVPYGRGTGEVLKGPLMLLGAFDDMRLNKKLGDREDMSSVIEYLNAAAAGIGKQATFLGAKNTAGAFFSEQFGTSTVSNLAYSAANLIPFNGLDRSISALALGPPDRSRTGAIWANIPIVRHLAHQPAINVFGDPWGNKSESALNQLWDRQWNLGLLPLNISAPLTGNQKRLYNFIGERLMGPSDPLRGALELRNGYLTDEEFYRYKQYRGKQMAQTWLTDLDRWRKLDDDSLSKAIAELSTKATKKAKDRFNYK